MSAGGCAFSALVGACVAPRGRNARRGLCAPGMRATARGRCVLRMSGSAEDAAHAARGERAEIQLDRAAALRMHVGVWVGVYKYFDAHGALVKQHRSRLTLECRGAKWLQTNEYMYDDGSREVLNFEGEIGEDGVLRYQVGRVEGEAFGVNVPADAEPGLVVLRWRFVGKNDQNTEIIRFVGERGANGKFERRMRAWQLAENGVATGFVQIVEQRARE
ncbi:hypothetical protein FVE85_8857 [Porphyridium purpureum]|uniref:DUF1579 domain-containing protein n=1 Tax=Porphyridium purpureum TaxID=35688 RepID=A0A5J4YRI3_PORPP|nr:hypothetical protein FVE85_8857 [Porphyridium purpureum]|eukprot:POR0195..scf296_7